MAATLLTGPRTEVLIRLCSLISTSGEHCEDELGFEEEEAWRVGGGTNVRSFIILVRSLSSRCLMGWWGGGECIMETGSTALCGCESRCTLIGPFRTDQKWCREKDHISNFFLPILMQLYNNDMCSKKLSTATLLGLFIFVAILHLQLQTLPPSTPQPPTRTRPTPPGLCRARLPTPTPR